MEMDLEIFLEGNENENENVAQFTTVRGCFALSPPLTQEQVTIVQGFSRMWHCGNRSSKPWLIGYWCGWTVSDDGSTFKCDRSHKVFKYIDWLHYLYYMFFSKWQVSMEGCIAWQGAEPNDFGTITAMPFVDEHGMRRTKFTVEAAKEKAPAKKVVASCSSSRPGLGFFMFSDLQKATRGAVHAPAEPAIAADALKVDVSTAWPAFEDLPVEILAKIACLMNVEDVMHFRAVCKRAKTCCTRGDFVSQWCEHWKHKLGCLVFTVQRGCIEQCCKLGEPEKKLSISGLLPAPGYLVVAASGGMVCCCNGDRNSIMVRNPVTKQWLELPPCPLVKFSTWHLISLPDEGDAAGTFFVVVDATCKCWFNSKLGTWSLGDGVYSFVISSANLLRRLGDGSAVYALVDLPGRDSYKGLVQLDLEDFAASRLLSRWHCNERPFYHWNTSEMFLLEHKGRIVLKYWDEFWALEQSTWSWQKMFDRDAELCKWEQLQAPVGYPDLSVLPVDITFASPRMNKNWDMQRCASKYWGIYPWSALRPGST